MHCTRGIGHSGSLGVAIPFFWTCDTKGTNTRAAGWSPRRGIAALGEWAPWPMAFSPAQRCIRRRLVPGESTPASRLRLDGAFLPRLAAFAAVGLFLHRLCRAPADSSHLAAAPACLADSWEEEEEDVSDNDTVCRFCFSGAETQQSGALVSPCQCRGTSQWVHLQCLRRWQHASLQHGTLESSCRVCKHRFQLPDSTATRISDWKASLSAYFSLHATDRLHAYWCAYMRVVFNSLLPLDEPHLQSWSDVILLIGATETRILGSRELRGGRPALVMLNGAAMASDSLQTGALLCWLAALGLGSAGDAFGAVSDALARGGRIRAMAPLFVPPARLLRALSGALLVPIQTVLARGEPLHRLTQAAQRYPAYRL